MLRDLRYDRLKDQDNEQTHHCGGDIFVEKRGGTTLGQHALCDELEGNLQRLKTRNKNARAQGVAVGCWCLYTHTDRARGGQGFYLRQNDNSNKNEEAEGTRNAHTWVSMSVMMIAMRSPTFSLGTTYVVPAERTKKKHGSTTWNR